jgi:hypothetical protein
MQVSDGGSAQQPPQEKYGGDWHGLDWPGNFWKRKENSGKDERSRRCVNARLRGI